MLKNNGLFRKEVFDSRKNRFVGNVIVSVPITFKMLALIFGLMGLALLIFIFSGEFTKKVRVSGQIMPNDGFVKIYSTRTSIVKDIYVKENDFVKVGQNLLHINNSFFLEDNKDLYDSINYESNQRTELFSKEIAKEKTIYENKKQNTIKELDYINKEISNANQLFYTTKYKLSVANDVYARYKIAHRNNAASLDEVQIKESQTLDLKNQLKQIESELDSLKENLRNKKFEILFLEQEHLKHLTQLKREESEINQEKIQSQSNSDQILKSPIDGKISIINIEKGQTIELNKILMSIVPTNTKLVCFLYVPSNAIGFIKPNTEVSIRYFAFPYQKFGLAKAKVLSISETPIPYQDLNSLGLIPMQGITSNEPVYIIKASLDKQTITAYGEEVNLKIGMLLEADIKLEKRKIYEWILEPLYTVTGNI
ncbi:MULTISPECIES: HlyD family secretion protein [Acinetobacter calcoaceticus/baumannii complex]|nr:MULTISPECIES: efflux RND transporter periplasmic adaptor subunit [Acinetobacter calcoaceticus/baumannii complex]MBJ9723704.1 HlyD family efflux transporter periplasmic adaptor subunit [Acinetobacter nosocomialis]MBP1460897.1 HlyD family efflux transporter periplasmic adaptor subunit [Acinetobacter nosocomialis]MBP1489467.1 HlyD family efflux transporter periplasmic adaptor subunit [Acinetobacter nosocomialis]MDB0098925.1 HlyD family secretion protein [Acinetobacter nosocomialis]MDB0103430.1